MKKGFLSVFITLASFIAFSQTDAFREKEFNLNALFFYLTKIGIYFDGDPVLFIYAVVAFFYCAGLIFVYRNRLRDAVTQ
jgi:hypothetical protein